MIRQFSQWLMLLAALIVLVTVMFFNMHLIQARAKQSPPDKAETMSRPDVAVILSQSAGYDAQVTAYGEARPHFELTLTAQVAGQVLALAPGFEPGHRVRKGTLLVQLEDSDYRAALSSAEKDLATARLSLLEEQRLGERAKAEWEASGLDGEPDSELVLRKPQLAAATAAVDNAERAVESAQKNLRQTQITAPFDALVVTREVAPGSFLQTGSQIATLYSTDWVEVTVSLSSRDWQNLPSTNTLNGGNWPVTLANVENGQQWKGRVLRTEQHLDSTTRQRALVVTVDQPLDRSPTLLPGTFLNVLVPGRRMDGLWELPSSALSQRGEIWYVTADDCLDFFSAQPRFSIGDTIFIQAPEDIRQSNQKILVHPLSSYLKGMPVNPVEEVSHG